ncbi:helix-turn-helix domain-containing protein [Bacillus paramycoides]|uniref:helix-turn-helix domain-containing protein n=1 Tax=Bacillus paramycoides TaxID=2026194 RepID=UPI00381E9795
MVKVIPKQSLATLNVSKRFEKVSTDIFYYVQLGLIKPFDVTLYIKYLELFNNEYGYAYPTIYQLEEYLNCSRQSIVSANKRLIDAGLLIIKKHKNNNNIYFPLQPHTNEDLEKQVPELLIQLNKRREKIYGLATADRYRLENLFES